MNDTVSILKELIAISSYVDENHNESALIEYIKDFLAKHTTFKVIEQKVEGNRSNLLAYKKKSPAVALFGHMDTVLPKTETKDPFLPRIEGDKLFGLGSVDMKSGLAIMLKLASDIDNDELALIFSVDEEYEFKGALKLKEIRDFNPKFIVNVEPTDNKILNGCRGITEFSFLVHGKSAHAGRKQFGINAIEKSVELIKEFQNTVTDTDEGEGGKSTVNLAYLHGGMLKIDENGKSEISGLGMIVPNYAEVNCEIRIANPIITSDFIKDKLNYIAESLGVTVDNFKFKFYLGSMLTPKSELLDLEKAIEEAGEEVVYADISLAGYYEVQLMQNEWKSKSVVFGPGPINMSHAANEYVSLDSVEKAEKVVYRYITQAIKNAESRS